ncbi:MAG: Holliday junction resolvase RuvX, partial [Acutalibacteraceae bacterium]
MIIISVDLGLARTGLAICDKTELLSSPLCVIEERDLDILADKITQKAKENRAELIVVGLPKNMDGSEGESAQRARAFAEALSEKTGLECAMQDERGTTITAH